MFKKVLMVLGVVAAYDIGKSLINLVRMRSVEFSGIRIGSYETIFLKDKERMLYNIEHVEVPQDWKRDTLASLKMLRRVKFRKLASEEEELLNKYITCLENELKK